MFMNQNSLQHHHRQWSFTLCLRNFLARRCWIILRWIEWKQGCLMIKYFLIAMLHFRLTKSWRDKEATTLICPQLMSWIENATISIGWFTHVRKIPSWAEDTFFFSVSIKMLWVIMQARASRRLHRRPFRIGKENFLFYFLNVEENFPLHCSFALYATHRVWNIINTLFPLYTPSSSSYAITQLFFFIRDWLSAFIHRCLLSYSTLFLRIAYDNWKVRGFLRLRQMMRWTSSRTFNDPEEEKRNFGQRQGASLRFRSWFSSIDASSSWNHRKGFAWNRTLHAVLLVKIYKQPH